MSSGSVVSELPKHLYITFLIVMLLHVIMEEVRLGKRENLILLLFFSPPLSGLNSHTLVSSLQVPSGSDFQHISVTILDLTSILVELNLLDEKLGVKKGKKNAAVFTASVETERKKMPQSHSLKGFVLATANLLRHNQHIHIYVLYATFMHFDSARVYSFFFTHLL